MPNPNPQDSSAFMRCITGWILAVYTTFILLFTVAGFCCEQSANSKAAEKWFEIAKFGFTSVGTAFTLVLGYYFGQKNIAREVEKEKDDLLESMQSLATPDQPEERNASASVQIGRPTGATAAQGDATQPKEGE